MLPLPWLLLTSILSQTGFAQTSSHFINPPDSGRPSIFDANTILTVGDTLQARWSTTLGQYSVYLWQQSLTAGSGVLGLPIFTKITGGPEKGGFNWTITQQAFDISQSNVFFLALGPTQDITSNTITSHYFNLTTKSTSESSTTTASSSTSTTIIGTASSTATASSTNTNSSSPATITQTPTAEASVTASSSTSTGTKVGLGVGISVVIAALLFGTYQLGMRRRQKQQATKRASTPPDYSYPILVSMDKHKQMPQHMPPQYLPLQEMRADNRLSHAATSLGDKDDRRTVISELPSEGPSGR